MTLNETIYRRKSTRKFVLEPLDNAVLADIRNRLKTLKPLLVDIVVQADLVGAADLRQSIVPFRAPHYLVISSARADGDLLNVGFMFQQMDLYLQSIGLGCCWLGMAKPAHKTAIRKGSTPEFAITLAFGRPAASPYRDLSEFKRKPLAELSDPADPRLEPARLAPSSCNMQPWSFGAGEDGVIHAYCVKHGKLKAKIFARLNQIDMGIALAHLYVANEATFAFFRQPDMPPKQGHTYVGSVRI